MTQIFSVLLLFLALIFGSLSLLVNFGDTGDISGFTSGAILSLTGVPFGATLSLVPILLIQAFQRHRFTVTMTQCQIVSGMITLTCNPLSEWLRNVGGISLGVQLPFITFILFVACVHTFITQKLTSELTK